MKPAITASRSANSCDAPSYYEHGCAVEASQSLTTPQQLHTTLVGVGEDLEEEDEEKHVKLTEPALTFPVPQQI